MPTPRPPPAALLPPDFLAKHHLVHRLYVGPVLTLTPPHPWAPMTDAEWDFLRRLLPPGPEQGLAGRPIRGDIWATPDGPRADPARARLDAVFRAVMTKRETRRGPGRATWTDAATEDGPKPDTLRRTFRRLAEAGFWHRLLRAVADLTRRGGRGRSEYRSPRRLPPRPAVPRLLRLPPHRGETARPVRAGARAAAVPLCCAAGALRRAAGPGFVRDLRPRAPPRRGAHRGHRGRAALVAPEIRLAGDALDASSLRRAQAASAATWNPRDAVPQVRARGAGAGRLRPSPPPSSAASAARTSCGRTGWPCAASRGCPRSPGRPPATGGGRCISPASRAA